MPGFSWEFLTLRVAHKGHQQFVNYILGFPTLALGPEEVLACGFLLCLVVVP